MKSFEQFLALLALIPDPRRAEGKLYQLPHVLLFSILAIVSGANSYRGVKTFIKVHRQKLNKAFKIGWKRPPAHTSIRFILQGLKAEDVEKAFREHAANLNSGETVLQRRHAPFRRSDGRRQKAQSSRNPHRRRIRRGAGGDGDAMGALRRRHHSGRAHRSDFPARDWPLEAVM